MSSSTNTTNAPINVTPLPPKQNLKEKEMSVNKNYNIIHNNLGDHKNKITELQQNSMEVYHTTNNNPYSGYRDNYNYRYIGPNVSGYRELPTVYDGYAYDVNQLQITQNTLYITGVIVCTSLLIVGVMIGSSKS